MTTYYVSTTGNDGTKTGSSDDPFASINKAVQRLKAGDELVVRSGTYKEQVWIGKSGAADKYIVIRAEEPGTVKIEGGGRDAGFIIGGNYVQVDGFEIAGAGAGITTASVHHIAVTRNVIYDSVGNGISINKSDFVLVEGNTTYDNAKEDARSGISVFHPVDVTGDTTTQGFRIIIRGNLSYDNVTETGARTDGNGVIIDSATSPKGTYPAYRHPILVENNVVFGNGGAGIQAAWSDNVTVRNNTSWHNSQSPAADGSWKAELSNMNSNNTTWTNNIAVADPRVKGASAISNVSFKGMTNQFIEYLNNLTFNGKVGEASVFVTKGNAGASAGNGNLLGIDPMFIDAARHDFRVFGNSPAVDGGASGQAAAASDFLGKLRAGIVDIGAFDIGGKATDPDTGTGTGAGGPGHDLLRGGDGADSLAGNGGNDTLIGNGGNDTLAGGAGNDSLLGGAGNDRLTGEAGNDVLTGGSGADVLRGGEGNDVLTGGTGSDTLTGGPGADRFVFASAAEAAGDVITDFRRGQGDRIDLSGIDADVRAKGNQAFVFIGEKGFSGTAGELRYKNGMISGDQNGDKVADFHVGIADGHGLGAGDFIL